MTQLTLDAAESHDRKEAGLDAVESVNLPWLERMRGYAREISLKSGQVSANNLRVFADQLGLHPTTPNAYGAIFRGRQWKHVGWEQSAVPSRKQGWIQTWRYEA